MANIKVIVAIPTTDSGPYIYASLARIRREVSALPQTYGAELVVCLNGTKGRAHARSEIQRFLKDHGGTFLDELEAGKNRAINALTEYARRERADIIHFFDDDVVLREGSLRINLDALVQHRRSGEAPILVGSHFFAIRRSLREFLTEGPSLPAALRRWYWHNVFRVAFEADSPSFCSGQSMGVLVRWMPSLPDDATGITDDTYVSNFAWLHGEVMKPQGSEVYFQVSSEPDEWLRQQLRIHAGVVRAMACFPGQQQAIQEFIRWPYSHIHACRVAPQRMSLRRRLFFRVYRGWSDRVDTSAASENGAHPIEWARAVSTKSFAPAAVSHAGNRQASLGAPAAGWTSKSGGCAS